MMSTATPDSVYEQLLAYRRTRKQMEENEAADAPPPITEPVTQDKPPDIGRRGVIWAVLLTLGAGLNTIWNPIGSALKNAVLPDHLKKRNKGNIENKGHLLTDIPEESSSPEPASPLQEEEEEDWLLAEDRQGGGGGDTVGGGHPTVGGDGWRLRWAELCLKVLLWLVVWKVFVLWQFGAVYFLATCFILIWYNLRPGAPRTGEVSAYSVFNRDLRRIHGTVTPEQLQREMLFRL